MASSRKAGPEAGSGRLAHIPPTPAADGALLDGVRAALRAYLTPRARLCVGLSGGLDSVVLLHLMRRLRQEFSFVLEALHVHHGLSPNADAWAQFCQGLCHDWQVPLHVTRVQVSLSSGLGLEAAARAARYAAFAKLDADAVLLAQHQDDQAETVLLQLLRGAGVKGLAAMPEERRLISGVPLLRPLLAYSRASLSAYAEAEGLVHIEDESNAVREFARNFLRHEVLPLLARRFPACRGNLARSAAHLAEAAQLLDELAAEDLARARLGAGLSRTALAGMSRARAGNLLRHFLALKGVPAPSSRWLFGALDQLLMAAAEAQVEVGQDGWRLRRYRDRIEFLCASRAPESGVWTWSGEGALALGSLGVLAFTPTLGLGLSRRRLTEAPVTVRLRQGGERLQPDARRPRRALKKLWQEQGVPPWQRERLPLLYCGEELAWVAGLGADAAFQAAPNEPGWLIDWRRSEA